ncbi:MAG: alpha/beta fold hydrolase [Treponema sp.]|nr:alpha/beta fold hydrolase [Treponema sp.]
MRIKIFLLYFILVVFLAAGITGCVSSDNSKSSNQNVLERGREAYIEEPLFIGYGTEYALPGILTIPNGSIPDKGFPAAVIVHGSGPVDMDGSVFAYKVYFDIADYLSANGIAVLRYDKRTYAYGQKMVDELGGSLTVYEETIEDALLASELLKADPRINENKVFVIGHSLGGMLAPRIQTSGADFAGLILLAGSPRFFLDLSYDQNVDYIEKMMTGEEKENALASLAGWDDMVNAIVTLPDDAAKMAMIENGMSAYYLKDLYNNPAANYIKDIKVPFLVLQGSDDFQVRANEDYTQYKELLSGRDNVTFILYEGLNHMFIKSTTGYLDEYYIPDNVDTQVLNDIADWIKRN